MWSLHELGKSDVDRHFLKKTLLYFCILLLEKLSTKMATAWVGEMRR